MMKRNFCLAGALLLAACAPTLNAGGYTLARQAAAPSGINPVASASVGSSGGSTSTTIRLSGLAANTPYVAHYHSLGTASTDPCTSGGAAIMESKMVGTSDAGGALTLSGSVADAAVLSAAYLNVHTARDAAGTPADAGIACTPVKLKP